MAQPFLTPITLPANGITVGTNQLYVSGGKTYASILVANSGTYYSGDGISIGSGGRITRTGSAGFFNFELEGTTSANQIGQFGAISLNSSSTRTNFASIKFYSSVTTAGSEKGELRFSTNINGSLTDTMTLTGYELELNNANSRIILGKSGSLGYGIIETLAGSSQYAGFFITDTDGRGIKVHARTNYATNTGFAIAINPKEGATSLNEINSLSSASLTDLRIKSSCLLLTTSTSDTSTATTQLDVRGNIYTNGKIGVNSTIPNAQLDVRPAAAGNIGLYIRGFSGQSAALFQIVNSTPTSLFAISSTGVVQVQNTTGASSTTTGSLIVSGGVGIANQLYVGGVVNLASTVTFASLAGTTSRMLEVDASGNLSASQEIIAAFIIDSTIRTQLETSGNWNTSAVYTGSALVGGNQGQFHYDSNNLFMLVDNYTPIKLPRLLQQTVASYTTNNTSTYTGIDNTSGSLDYASITDLNALRTAYENLKTSYNDLRTKLISSRLIS